MNIKTKKELAAMIDHTQLKASAVENDILKLCNEAVKYGFASVCINPVWVPYAFSKLNDTNVKVCTVIGFPLGANSTAIKAEEAAHAVLQGAQEIDMVINIGYAKAHDYDAVQADISAVVNAVHNAERSQGYKVIVKVIIETCYLTDEEKTAVCVAAKKAGADFVKTSTGFGTPIKNNDENDIPNGATVHDVELMRKAVDSAEPLNVHVFVKASGGIKDTKTALDMINAGADRLGVSAGIKIIDGFTE
ncbi:MAG: deoxyribose-phosphate aldolase [Treponema sp.]|jgi:deoxyribose-phosphate aldolase|nr:deoxyribose-phosphate aldolase [Treponema sp.]